LATLSRGDWRATHFVEVGHVERLSPETPISFTIDDTAIAVWKIDGQIFAIDDLCIRCGSSLAGGTLVDRVLKCSSCDWQYDVATGCVKGVPGLRIETFAVKVVDSRVLIGTTPKKNSRVR
jgi:nitrite reductase/ring-hydroxylating ferredoxin subunit